MELAMPLARKDTAAVSAPPLWSSCRRAQYAQSSLGWALAAVQLASLLNEVVSVAIAEEQPMQARGNASKEGYSQRATFGVQVLANGKRLAERKNCSVACAETLDPARGDHGQVVPLICTFCMLPARAAMSTS